MGIEGLACRWSILETVIWREGWIFLKPYCRPATVLPALVFPNVEAVQLNLPAHYYLLLPSIVVKWLMVGLGRPYRDR